MRNTIILLSFLCCMAFLSCNRYCCDLPEPVNLMKATRNGAAWEIQNTVGRLLQDSLILVDTSVTPQQTELIVFKLKFSGADSYTLTPANVEYAYVPQMDNPYVFYTLDPAFANIFKIVYYDTGSGMTSGTFSIKLNKDPANSDTRYPATVSFLNGSFRVQLSK
ncbi:MAG: hypothetical protein JSU01_10400 [Bacteroidetes bacterium]|nr:hypothetical protein [Bacteroidota bacterium]